MLPTSTAARLGVNVTGRLWLVVVTSSLSVTAVPLTDTTAVPGAMPLVEEVTKSPTAIVAATVVSDT